MTPEKVKEYIVALNGGSGCLFQPMTGANEYTYILTAKHLFEGTRRNDDGAEEPYDTEEGTVISIIRSNYQAGQWIEMAIPFEFRRGDSYFASPDTDAAILKIDFIAGFGEIFQSNITNSTNGYGLTGYPEILADRVIGERSTIYGVMRLIAPGAHTYGAQLENVTYAHQQVKGMSGGGIVKIIEEGISIIGIQSKVTHSMLAGGQIDFIPIHYFNRIVDDIANKEKLAVLYPPYLHSFGFLKNNAFLLEVDQIDEDNIAGARFTLRNKAEQIVNSDITPQGIRELFESRLLIIEDQTSCFSHKEIWIAWLEFLTILNIVKYDALQKDMLSEIFNSYRLKYIDGHGWTNIREDLGKSDYIGLKPNSKIFVSSKTPPKSSFILEKGKIIDIARPYDKRGFRTDGGIDPFTCFDFVHLEHFKEICIIRKLPEYQNMNEVELLDKLKSEYHALFN